MSEIRVGLSFEPEASDKAEEVRAFLTDNNIEVVEVENSSEAIEEYLEVELLLLTVMPKSIEAKTRKFGELVLGPRDRQPSEFPIYEPDGTYRGRRSTDEIYSDTSIKVVFQLDFSERYRACLLLLEIVSLAAFLPYRREIPFVDRCSSDLQDYLKNLVIEGSWNSATEILSKLNSVISPEVIKLDLSEETIAQIEGAISHPIDSATAPLILAVLQFAEAASEMLPVGLWRRAEEKQQEMQQYVEIQQRVPEAIKYADDLMRIGEFYRAARVLREILDDQGYLPTPLAHELEDKMREVEIYRQRGEHLKSLAHKAQHLLNKGEFSAVLRLIEQISPDLRNHPELRYLSRETEELFEVGWQLPDLLSLQDAIENHLVSGNLDDANTALRVYESRFLSHQSPFHRFEEPIDRFAIRSKNALRVSYSIQQLREQRDWGKIVYEIHEVEYLDLTPAMRESLQYRLAQVKNEAEFQRLNSELRELESRLLILTHEIEAIPKHTINIFKGAEYQKREANLRREFLETQEKIESLKSALRALNPNFRSDLELALEQTPTALTARDKVQFTLFSPSKIRKTVRYSMVVYAHRPEMSAQIEVDAKKFVPEMGEHPPKQRSLPEPVELAPKAEITIVPECEGIEFEPKSLTKTWEGDFVRYNFDFKAPEDFKEAEAWIRISVQIKGFEIASLKTSCEVVAGAKEAGAAPVTLPDNPLIEAKNLAGLNQAVATPYKNIFVSYSHKDQPVALKCAKLIEQMLGSKVFIDVNGLRTGHDWQLEIAKAIDAADIFELLWSEHTADSEFCRYEWDYALKTKCPDTRCVGVIRPIYWKEPFPKPPAELEHLQFGFVDLSDLIGKENAE